MGRLIQYFTLVDRWVLDFIKDSPDSHTMVVAITAVLTTIIQFITGIHILDIGGDDEDD